VLMGSGERLVLPVPSQMLFRKVGRHFSRGTPLLTRPLGLRHGRPCQKEGPPGFASNGVRNPSSMGFGKALGGPPPRAPDRGRASGTGV
jgi:hypothetical protein